MLSTFGVLPAHLSTTAFYFIFRKREEKENNALLYDDYEYAVDMMYFGYIYSTNEGICSSNDSSNIEDEHLAISMILVVLILKRR